MRKCAMPACKAKLSGSWLMCQRHWCKVPQNIATDTWRAFYDGTRHKKHPTPEFTALLAKAVAAVTAKEAGKFV